MTHQQKSWGAPLREEEGRRGEVGGGHPLQKRIWSHLFDIVFMRAHGSISASQHELLMGRMQDRAKL